MSLIEVSDIPVPLPRLSSLKYWVLLADKVPGEKQSTLLRYLCMRVLLVKSVHEQSDRFAQPANRNDGDGVVPA